VEAASVTPEPPLDLENDPDYVALSASLDLLANQYNIAREDIVTLRQLRDNALADPTKFASELKQNGTIPALPRPQKVVKAPLVGCASPGVDTTDLEQQVDKGIVDRAPFCGSLRIFHN
jgi:hypothetical protein